MSSHARNGKRDFDHRADHRTDRRGPPQFKKRPKFQNNGAYPERTASTPTQIPSASSYQIGLHQMDKYSSLSELKERRKQANNWRWDKAPSAFETFNVQALKVFGVVSPIGDLAAQKLPEELQEMKRSQPLTPEYSWIYRKVGDKILDDIKEAALSAEARPSNLPSFRGLLVNNHTIVSKNCSDVDEAARRYGAIRDSMRLDETTFAVLPHGNSKPVGDDFALLAECEVIPAIEVLNAVPLKEASPDTLQIIQSRCEEAGGIVKRTWMKEGSAGCPYNLVRVFVELVNHDQTTKIAQKLGQMAVHGRELVVAINRSPELQQP